MSTIPLAEPPQTIPRPLQEGLVPLPPFYLPYMVFRSAGVPWRSLAGLHFTNCVESLDKCFELEAQTAKVAKPAIDLLERLIGAVKPGPARFALIRLKRDIFNDRMPDEPLDLGMWAEIESSTAPAELALMKSWIDDRRERKALVAVATEVFATEMTTNRKLLWRAGRRKDFSSGLELASPALAQDFKRYAERPSQFSPGQIARMERSLVRYFTRSAVKLSPFSTFMRSRIVKVQGQEGPTARLPRRRASVRRSIRINRAILARLAQFMSEHAELGDLVPLLLNPAVVHDGGKVLALRLRHDNGQATRLRVPRESLVHFGWSKAAAVVTAHFSPEAAAVPRGLLVAQLSRKLGGPQAASAFIDQLVNAGLLLHKIPLPQDDSRTVVELLQFLSALPLTDERLIRLIGELERLQELESGYERAAGPLRPALEKSMLAAVEAAHEALGVSPALDWSGRVISEEVVEEPLVEMPPPERWAGALSDLRQFISVYGPSLDTCSSVRGSVRELLHTKFAGGPVPFLSFAAAYRQALSAVDGLDRDARSLRNPFRVEALETLEQIREEMGAMISRPSDAVEIDLRAVAEQYGWSERFSQLRQLGPMGGAYVFSCFVQPCFDPQGADALVVNQMDTGPCKALLRAVSAMADVETKAKITNELAETLRAVWGAMEPCSLYTTFDYEPNACPTVTARVIDYAGDASAENRTIPLGALWIGVTPEGNLRLSADGQEIVAVSFGSMAAAFQPLTVALLLELGRSEPILVRPFDPRNWVSSASHSWPEVAPFPRLTFGRCILRRRGWLVQKASLPKRGKAELPFDYFARVRKWQRTIGLPNEVFVRVRSLGERKYEETAANRSATLPQKPQYVDFRSYLLVESLDDLFKDVLTAAYFEEAQPSVVDWDRLGLGRAMEWAIDLYTDAREAHREKASADNRAFDVEECHA